MKILGFCKYLFLGMFLFAIPALHANKLLLEAKEACFIATDHLFRTIYGTGGGLYGAEFTAEFGRNIYGWLSADYFSKKGRSCGLHEPTKIKFIPLGFGLKYVHECDDASVYIGLGGLGTHLKIKDCSSAVKCKREKWGFGGIAKLGTYIDLSSEWFLDLFANYSFIKVKFHGCENNVESHNANLSGLALGIGLGYRFE